MSILDTCFFGLVAVFSILVDCAHPRALSVRIRRQKYMWNVCILEIYKKIGVAGRLLD